MSNLEVTILGTSSMIPTKTRNPTSIHIRYKNTSILVDCAEGTQRQIKFAKIKANKIRKILITHWHGDHVLGLPGLLQTLGNSNYTGKLEIFGPVGSKEFFSHMLKGFAFDTPIEIEVIELSEENEGVFFENNQFKLEFAKLKHGIECNGYSFIEKDYRKFSKEKLEELKLPVETISLLQTGTVVKHNGKKIDPENISFTEKGKKVTITTDTEVCAGVNKLARDSNLFICEATYLDNLSNKAIEYNHMTSKQAAIIAKESNVEKLVLTHFSGRYSEVDELENEAKETFENTVCAEDFMKFEL